MEIMQHIIILENFACIYIWLLSIGYKRSTLCNDTEGSNLSKWLEKYLDTSWDQLFSATDNLPQPPLPEIAHQGMNQI